MENDNFKMDDAAKPPAKPRDPHLILSQLEQDALEGENPAAPPPASSLEEIPSLADKKKEGMTDSMKRLEELIKKIKKEKGLS